MKQTPEEFQPRRDGWFEHRAQWGEVVVGTVLADPSLRTPRWEVVAVAHGQQVEYGYTLWMRIRDQVSGEEHTVRPHPKTDLVTVLTQDPTDTRLGGPTAPTDSEAIMLLVEKLGATHLASMDNATGEITCPDYAAGYANSDNLYDRELVEHLRFAHGLAVDDNIKHVAAATLHGQSHDPKHPDVGKGGFPHRHVPEDLSIL